MGVNQSKLNYEPSLRSQRSSRIVGDGDSRPNTSKLYQQRTIVKEETEPTLSRCTTRHGVLDPTTHSHYNDTTLKQPSKSTTSTITRHNNNQHVLDSGYSSGWQQSSVLFSHISSNITTATDLSHFCLDDKPTNTASIVAQVAAATTCSNTSSASSSIAPHVIEKAATPISTKSILNQLAHAPHETQVILDRAFAFAYEQSDQKEPVYAAYTAALQWSQQVDDEDMRRAAQVWVARYHVEYNQHPANGFNQLKELAHGGCWQAFFPLALCYLKGVTSDDSTIIQPVDTTMARQWFSTAAQLDPKTTTDKTVLPTVALAQLHLGILMTREHDDRKAFDWFLKSANNGNAQAQFIVAIHYAMGLEVDVNKIKAKSYLERSAKQGFVHSETALGILHLEDEEYDQGLMWLERAEQKGDPRALFRLGLLYKSGQHRHYQTSATAMATVKQDWEKTVHYFKAAAEHGHPGALFQLALGYQKGSLGLQRNLALADQLIQQSAKAGYTPAQRFLGFMYREGWVITDASTTMAGSRIHHKKSDKMAFQWFYRAAQRHDLYAYILVGQCYEQGRGVPVNRKTALEYYQRAAENENSPYQDKAQHAMADLLLRMGRVSEAYHWFTLAASRQDDIEQEEEEPCDEEPLGWYDHWPTRRAKLMVARYHLHGWGGVTIDRQRAFNILTELTAHTNEDGHAHYWLATCYLEGISDVCKINHAAAFQHYSIAAETSVLDSEYQLACMYANGKGIDRDLSKALAWYKKAASHGHEDALVTLGYHYYTMATKISQDNDTDTKKGNLSKVMHYFEKAADMGNVNAMERLGDILLSLASTPTLTLKGKRDRDHQRRQAVHYYTKAASMDHATAQRELGKLYHAGIGVAQDYERAFALFSRAAAQDDPAATLLLGNCYEHGHGTTQDQEKALELYQRSAQLDHPFAFFAAAQLYNELNRIQEAYTQYKLTANDHRLQSSTMTKTAKWMMSRYILDYDDIFGETKEDAFHMLSHLAITDNDDDPFTPAFYWLAYCFQYGIGTSIDLVQAIEWYEKAAEEDDNVEALVQLGLIHSQGGPGVPVDQGHAIDLIQRAAERGHPAGQYQLGMAYWRGLHSMTADEEKATRLFQDAATQGHGQSHWALGQMAYEKNDKTMALHCWQNGTQQGDPSSMRCQARLLLEHMPQENDLFMEQQYMDAIELLAGAAQAGDIDSHFYLGRMYLAEAALLKANGMTPQEQQLLFNEEERLMMIQQQHDEKTELAKQYLEKAAMADHVEAMFLLAQIWHEQQQYATAHKCYERAAEQNHPLARVMRARYLLGDGILGVEPDPQAAFKELMDCAKNQGCVEAYHSLGQCHEYGLGTKQDYQQALDWYLKSFQVTGDAEALYRIGTLYAQGLVSPSDTNRSNDMEAHHWFEMACRMGNHARAHYRLGLYYLDGIKDQDDTVLLDSNQDTALQHLQLAAQQNDCDAMVMLGTLLNDEEWLDHAAQLGSRDALRELGKLYYLGNGVTEEQDFEQAYMLFHQAASLGDGDAAMFVGMYHEHGIHHIVPDLNEALEWYQVAVDNDQQSSWMAKLAMARVLHQLPGMQMRAYTCFQAAYEHAPSDSERILPDIMMARYRLHQWHSTCTDEEQRDAMTTLVKYANQGDARVFYQVAQCYDNGNVVEKDMHKAFEWYTRLEEFHAQLDEDAQDMLEEELQQDIRKTLYRLAEFYRNGWITQVDLAKAALLETRASFSTEEENHIQSLPSPTSLS